MFKNKIAVITGGAQGIGRCIADEFRKQGASVCIIDRQPNEYFVGDISSEQVLRPGRFPAPGRPGGEPDGYRQYGALPLLG